jgi:hypothetical protein
MADSQSSPRRVQAAERRALALELRKAGATYLAIGRTLGYSEQRAHAIVTAELRRLNAERVEAAAEVARLECERLDALLLAVWPQAKAGDGPAIDRVLSIMARRAKLQGLDMPDKFSRTKPDGTTPEETGDEFFANIERYAAGLRALAERGVRPGPVLEQRAAEPLAPARANGPPG